MIYAGLDIGTTGSKITIFENEKILKNYYLSYKTNHKNNEHTIDPISILNSVTQLINQSLDEFPSLRAVGLTTFGETFVLLDKDDNVLCDALLYTDSRGEKEAKLIEKLVTKDRLGEITGQIGRGMFSLPKILCLLNEDPSLKNKLDKIFLVEDFIIYKLTKERKIDYSSASRTLAFDIKNKLFSDEILEKVNLSSKLFSNPCKIGEIVGEYKRNRKKVSILAISHDQIANAVGAGILKEGNAVDGNGTCECITVISNNVKNEKILYEKGFGIIPFVKDNYYASYALSNTCGSLIDWVINTYFSFEKLENSNIFDYLNEKVKDRVSDLFVLPYFAGASTPYMDLTAKGAIVNLTLGTTKEEIYLATLESLCYEMYLSLLELEDAGIFINKLVATGGCSQNSLFLQLKADIFNKTIYKLDVKDAGTIGSAIIVGTTLGIFSSLEDGVNKMVSYNEMYVPREEYHQKHMEKFEKFKKIYSSLKEVF